MNCVTCKFFDEDNRTCHRWPPIGGIYSPGVFPKVDENGWCGEYGAIDSETDVIRPEAKSLATDANAANSDGQEAESETPTQTTTDVATRDLPPAEHQKEKRKYIRRNKK